MAQNFKIILQEKVSLTANTQHFRFIVDGMPGFTFKPGQFISLHIESGGKEHRRNYSVANAPGSDNLLELAMAYVPNGLASGILGNLRPGDSLNASGPYGQFVLKDEILPKRYILIGTGTGITPYRAMLAQLSELLAVNPLEVVIMQGVRTAEDLLYGGEFVEFAARFVNSKFYACYSRGLPAQSQTYEVSGYVQDSLNQLNIDPEGDIVYLCGNPNMVDDTFNKLMEMGLDRARIRREKYIASRV